MLPWNMKHGAMLKSIKVAASEMVVFCSFVCSDKRKKAFSLAMTAEEIDVNRNLILNVNKIGKV